MDKIRSFSSIHGLCFGDSYESKEVEYYDSKILESEIIAVLERDESKSINPRRINIKISFFEMITLK